MPEIDLGKVIGKDFEYNDFTPEQLEALKVKGDAGDNKIIIEKEGTQTREDLILKKEGQFTKILSGDARETHKLLVDDVLVEDGSPLMSTISQFCNPNLLINGDFKVWQRGETFMLTDNTSPYTADRHRCSLSDVGDNVIVLHTENGLKLATNVVTANANRYLSYQMEDKDIEKIKGKVVTFSIKVRKLTPTSEVTLSVFGQFESNWYEEITLSNTEFDIFKFTFVFNPNFTDRNSLYSLNSNSVEVGGGFEVAWVKLELGSIATPFVPRSYGEELALCQRYFQKITQITAVSLTPTSTYYSGFSFKLMRTKPSSSTGSIVELNGTNIKADFVGFNLFEMCAGYASLKKNHGTAIHFNNVFLDAEIY